MTAPRFVPRADGCGSLRGVTTDRRGSVPCASGMRVWLKRLEEYGNFFLMKKTLHIDEKLLEEARAVSGAATDTETVRLGLEALVRHAASDRLRVLRGSEPGAQNVPRRREKQPRKRWASSWSWSTRPSGYVFLAG